MRKEMNHLHEVTTLAKAISVLLQDAGHPYYEVRVTELGVSIGETIHNIPVKYGGTTPPPDYVMKTGMNEGKTIAELAEEIKNKKPTVMPKKEGNVQAIEGLSDEALSVGNSFNAIMGHLVGTSLSLADVDYLQNALALISEGLGKRTYG